MSQTINGSSIPTWMANIVHPVNSFESEINNKIGVNPHYPGPIHNIGGLHLGSNCRIPGVQPFVQSIVRPTTCIPHCLTKQCFEYGNTRFPPTCGCGDKYDCRTYNSCQMAGTTLGYKLRSPTKSDVGTTLGYKLRSPTKSDVVWAKGSCGRNNCSSTCGSCNHNSNVIFY